MFQITNKIKQFFGGNWGKPNNLEQRRTEVPDDFFDDVAPKWTSRKKKKKKPYIAFWGQCPFCHEKLIEIPPEQGHVLRDYLGECQCGAIQVPDCPACHCETWMKNKIYKHQWLGCGFEGKKKETNNELPTN